MMEERNTMNGNEADNRFDRHEADELTRRIADRLGQRQQKLERMAQWERSAKGVRLRPVYVLTAVAACIAVVLMVVPWASSTQLSPVDELGIDAPSLSEYRAGATGITEINRLINEKDYSGALQKTEYALKASDQMLNEISSTADFWGDDEALVYEEQLERQANSELRWAYIYLLIKTDNYRKARKQLKVYLADAEYCDHRTEAEALLEKIK